MITLLVTLSLIFSSKFSEWHILRFQMSWLYVIIMSRTSFRENPHCIVCQNVKDLLVRGRCHIWSLSDSNETRTHNHLVRQWTLNHLAKLTILAKWLSVHLQTKWSWVRISFLLLLLLVTKKWNKWYWLIIAHSPLLYKGHALSSKKQDG